MATTKSFTLQLTIEDHDLMTKYKKKCIRQGKDINALLVDIARQEVAKDDYTLPELAYDLGLGGDTEKAIELVRKAGFDWADKPLNPIHEGA